MSDKDNKPTTPNQPSQPSQPQIPGDRRVKTENVSIVKK